MNGLTNSEMKMNWIKGCVMAVLVLGLARGAQAQAEGEDTDSGLATATTITNIVVEGVDDLVFGTVVPNSEKTVGAVDGNVSVDSDGSAPITGDEQRGVLKITLAEGLNFNVQIEIPENLALTSNSEETLSADIYDYYIVDSFTGQDDDIFSGIIPNGDNIDFTLSSVNGITTATNDNTLTMPDGSGEVYVVLGGTVFPGTDVALGTYEGTITLTASITN